MAYITACPPPSWNRTTLIMPPISIPVAKQPSMDLYNDNGHAHADEKPPAYHDHAHEHDGDEAAQWSLRARPNSTGHKHCHNGSLKRILFPALMAIVALCGIFALFCFLGDGLADPGEMIEGLFHVKRAVDGGSGSGSGTESAFTKHKLYLIVVFVGLVVVVILGVMLSAWCCRGAFENPCCCPCYLCACCGGLGTQSILPDLCITRILTPSTTACLECIGCGLCAEGVEQM
ncbi:hypothetical protein B0H19DRAFT_1184817 [Mycena capillaripes]|nr:hypothetical protein B0H19DRAFT_1184817 [Mycena capillaripes]